MTAHDRLEQMAQQLATASAALDNMRSSAQEIIDDPFTAAADPMLIEAQHKAVEAAQHAEIAIAHIERLQNKIAESTAARARAAQLRKVAA